ncbi:MAG: rhomboid family intramembrane serine protease [Bdellovibrionota bacterium]
METKVVLRETWLSRKPRKHALDLSLLLVALLVAATFLYLNGLLAADRWMAASGAAVFDHKEIWRAWTTLFAHADLGHLLGNIFLFLPFSYFLAGYYPRWFFPVLGFFTGGLVNFAVLATMPREATLVGVSGVVYWMGAAWVTLYLLIERKEPLRRRWGKAVIVTAALFIPDTFRPEVSYLSHYLGFLTGVVMAAGLFRLRRKEFRSAEEREYLLIEDGIGEEEWSAPLENSP